MWWPLPTAMMSSYGLSKADSPTFHPVSWEETVKLPQWRCSFLTHSICCVPLSDLCLEELEGQATASLKLPVTSLVQVCQNRIHPLVENFSGLSHASLPKSRNPQWSTSLPVAIYAVWCSQKGLWARNQNAWPLVLSWGTWSTQGKRVEPFPPRGTENPGPCPPGAYDPRRKRQVNCRHS